MIIGAAGDVLAEADDKECMIMHLIDTANTDKVRSDIPVFSDRRADLY
jgi:predicted amidohydrolase